jgi:rhodanese-related sulfurtransferase
MYLTRGKSILILGLTAFLLGCPPRLKKPTPFVAPTPSVYHEITPEEVKRKLDAGEGLVLLDVRTNEEYAQGHLEGSILIPLDQIPARYQELDTDREIIVYCRSGRRSGLATRKLLELGFGNVKNMRGGIIAWPYAVVK